MIKAIYCLRRLPRFDAGQFKELIDRLYRSDLSGVAKEYRTAKMRLYRRGDSASEGFALGDEGELDAILELSWNDARSFEQAVEATRPRGGLGLIFAKLGNIADLSRSHYMVMNRSVSGQR